MIRKEIAILPLATLLLSSFTVVTNPTLDGGSLNVTTEDYGYQNEADMIIIPPSYKDHTSTITIKASYTGVRKKNISLYVINPLTEERELLYTYQENFKSIYKTITYYENYTRSQYAKSANKVPTFILESKYASEDITLFSKTCLARYYDYKSASNLTCSSFTSSPLIYYYSRSAGVSYLTETFTFKASDNDEYYLDLGADNSLNLSFPMFKYTPNNEDIYLEEACDTPQAMYIDAANVFPYVSSDSIVTYDGSLSKDSDGYFTFTPSTKYYIDPITRVLYPYYVEGRMQTKHLYFPIGAKEKVEAVEGFDNLIYISAHFGYSKTLVTFCYRLVLNSSNLVGSCANSEYCIEVNGASPDFETGTKVDN